MTTHAGLSDDRVDAIIRNHEADPEAGDDTHTPREVVQLAREVKARRAADREGLHVERNRLNVFASATEWALSLHEQGKLDLSGVPLLLEQLRDCRRILEDLARGDGQEDRP